MTSPGAAAADWRGPHLVGLVERLREAGFAIGTSELIDATQLLLELARRSSAPLPPARLRAALKPVLCKDSEKRADFDRVFDSWSALVAVPGGEAAAPPAEVSIATDGLDRKRDWRGALGLLVLAAAATGLYWAVRDPPPLPPEPPPSTAPAAGGAAAVPPAPAPPVAAPAAAIEGYVPTLRQNAELRPAWAWAFALLPLLALLAFNLPALYIGRTRARRGGQPLLLDAAPLEREARRLVPPLSGAVVDRLARHLRGQGQDLQRAVRRPRIDERRTVEATLRNRGLPTVRWAGTPVHPSYLLLVDVAHERDPRGRLFFQWALRLQQQGLDVDIQVLRRDPAGRADSDPDELFFGPPGLAGAERARWQPLHRLRTPPFGQRLIVVSDGAPLVDDGGRWRRGALRARLQRWPQRALFTPLEMRDWGLREETLEQRQTPVDPGFTVLPLDESALASWTTLVLSGRLADITLADPQRFPALLRRGRGERFLGEEPPSAADVERLVVQLRLYLGESGLRWMAALALAPVVRWELTLLLGRTALAMQPRLADERSLSEALARYYRRLVRLPWLQRASIPDWLRLRLLMELPRREQQALQDRVRQLFGQLAPRDGREGIPLGFERPPLPGAAARPRGAEAPAEGDAIYLGTMSGLAAEDLLMRAPAGWARWADRLTLPPPRGVRERLGQVRDRLRNAWARLAFVEGLPHLGARPSSRWLAPLLALPLLALLSWAAWQAVPDGAAPVPFGFERRTAVVAPATGRVVSAAFTPDGRQVVVASIGGLAAFDARSGEAAGLAVRAPGRPELLAVSADGRFVVTADGLAGIRLFGARDGQPQELAGSEAVPGPVASLVFGADGRWLLAGAGRLFAWDLADRRRPPVQSTTTDIAAVAADPAGRWIAAARTNGAVVLWPLPGAELSALGEARTLAAARTASGTTGATQLAASADGGVLVHLARDGTLRRWRMPAGDLLGSDRLDTRSGPRLTVVGRGQAARIVIADSTGALEVRDADSGAVLGSGARADAAPAPIGADLQCVAASPDGERLALCGPVGLRLLQARPGGGLDPPLVAGGAPRRYALAALSPDGERVAAIGGEDAPVLWSHGGGGVLGAAPDAGHRGGVRGIAFVDGGERIVTAGADGLRFWGGRDGRAAPAAAQAAGPSAQTAQAAQSAQVAPPAPAAQAVQTAPVSPTAQDILWLAADSDGGGFVTAAADGRLQRWNATGNAVGAPVRWNTGRLTALAAGAGGQRVALAGTDGTVGELDLAAAAAAADANAESRVNPVASTAAQTVNLGAPAGALAYSRDGRLVAAGTDDGRMHVWSAGGAAPGTGPRRFEGHRSAIAAVGFDRDGERVVAVAQDGSIRLWDLASGRAIGSPLPGPARPAGRPALSADGRAVAMPVVVADTPAAAAEAPGERSPLAGLRPAPTPAGPMAARAGSSTSREPVVVPAALTRTVVDPPQGPKAVDAARNALPVQQWPSPTAEASKNAAPAQQRVLPNSPPAAPPAATPAPAPALTPSPSPPVPGHGVQRWRLEPPPDPPRPSLSALANRLPGVLPAGAWWALGGVVFLLYAVHGVARAARLRRWLGSKGAP